MLAAKSTVKIGELATGQPLTVPIYRFKGSSSSAPSLYLQANVHGAEVQGNAVIFQLLKLLEQCQILGDITLVPLANPLAINQKSGEFTLGRFDPITGNNWNRDYVNCTPDLADWYVKHQELDDSLLITQYRQQLLNRCQQQLTSEWGITSGQRQALTLQSIAFHADVVLDLHTGPKSCKHLYCPEYAQAKVSLFNIGCTLLMPNEFAGAMDEAMFYPWWQLTKVAASHGRELPVAVEAYTLELGSQELIDLVDAKQDALAILAYLSDKSIIADAFQPSRMQRYACLLKDYKKFHAPIAGMVEYLAPLGKPLAAQQPLVNILRLDRYGTADELQTLRLKQDCIPVLHFASASVYQGTELYKVMTNYVEIPR